MTLTLELTPEVEARLRRKAAREGQDIAAYLLSVVNREAQEDSEEEQTEGNAYDLFAGRLGGIHSSGNRGHRIAAGRLPRAWRRSAGRDMKPSYAAFVFLGQAYKAAMAWVASAQTKVTGP